MPTEWKMILTASGGLVYHARAAFNGHRWQATQRSVSELVSKWLSKVRLENASCDTLVLVGPSAGYLLERDLFAKLARRESAPPIGDSIAICDRPFQLVVIDPDPLAKLIFRTRFPSSPIKWHLRDDLLPFTSRAPSDFADFLRSFATRQRPGQSSGDASPGLSSSSKIAVLFFGVLGQIDLHRDRFTRPPELARTILLKTVSDYPWASLHDLESTRLGKPFPRDAPSPEKLFGTSSLEPTGVSVTQAERLNRATEILENVEVVAGSWIDHDTRWLGQPGAIVPWLLSPTHLHLLGFSGTI